MPRNLPMTNPIIIARDIPLTIVDGFMSRRNIPALANANSGTIKKFTIGCNESSNSWSGDITLSEADSISFNQLSCLLSSIDLLFNVSSSSVLKLAIVRRIVFIYFLGANTGVAGTQNATNTPAMVGCIPELRNRNHTTPPRVR